eukprot:1149208-Pelagomonas_calceolata.AAC.2
MMRYTVVCSFRFATIYLASTGAARNKHPKLGAFTALTENTYAIDQRVHFQLHSNLFPLLNVFWLSPIHGT